MLTEAKTVYHHCVESLAEIVNVDDDSPGLARFLAVCVGKISDTEASAEVRSGRQIVADVIFRCQTVVRREECRKQSLRVKVSPYSYLCFRALLVHSVLMQLGYIIFDVSVHNYASQKKVFFGSRP